MNLSLTKFISLLYSYKFKIILITFTFFITSCIYVLTIENVYQASGLYKEAERPDSQPSFSGGGLSSLAALSGITSGTNNNKISEAVEILNSHVFLIEFIKKNNYEEEVFAVEKVLQNNTLVYKSKIYDKSKDEWVNGVVSDKDLFKKISSDLYISRDRITGFIRVTYRHLSPYFAKEFLDNLIKELNNQMRTNDLNEYKKAIEYLNLKLNNEIIQNQKNLISILIQRYLQKETVASISDEYVLKSIEPPYINLEKIGPNRKLTVIAITVFGLFLSLLIIFLSIVFKNRLSSE